MEGIGDLALIGNGTIGALIDGRGRIVWGCFPRFDGDPTFCALLREDFDAGVFGIEITDFSHAEQHYLENTAVLITRLYDCHGGGVEIADFAPRCGPLGQASRPMLLVRQLRPIAVPPRLTFRLRPTCGHGRGQPEVEVASDHIRYVMPDITLRLSTDAPIAAIIGEGAYVLDKEVTLLFGSDEVVPDDIQSAGRRYLDGTTQYWREWVRQLAIPFEWQAAVIRAAITLKLNANDDTGAIVAAMTTSLPESAHSGRNWDYRYCWLRDSHFVVHALNLLGATRSTERYVDFLARILASADGQRPLPMYRIDGGTDLEERIEPALPGYRGMGPVRIGNQAYRQVQYDVYGAAILAAAQVFFDQRFSRRGDADLFRRLEPLGERAAQDFDQPDAGLWELRGSARVHTYSAVTCWAACDRLARIATHLGLAARAAYWRDHARRMHDVICDKAWNAQRNAFVSTFGGDAMDASLLLLVELGFVDATDPRFAGTVAAVEQDLKRGDTVFRYVEKDDFGEPENAFLVCTFWYIDALAAIGRHNEARALFEKLLATRNRHGLLAEHVDTQTGELWGNFVQTYSMAGLIHSALRLSIPWDRAF